MDMAVETDFEELVALYYPSLYRFALSLTHQESDAGDLAQQTFYVWARKGHQLQDRSKVKSWLFTTLHREYLQHRRKFARYSECDLSEAEHELPEAPPVPNRGVDASAVLDALGQLDPLFKGPVALFYLEDYSYLEIGQILEIPLGTVKSRISRGIAQMQQLLADSESSLVRKVSHG
jgi:RNA polymerase sigma factor (sigma-70 family)